MKNYLQYLFFRGVTVICYILPARLLYFIALRIADLNFYFFDPKGREAVKANLRQVLPDASEDRIAYEARWAFRNFGKYLSEFFRVRKQDRRFFELHISIKGREHIEEARARGHGAILLSAHLSNWELGAGSMRCLYDYPVNVIAAMHRYGRINDLFMRERESMGLKVWDMHAAKTPGGIMRALKNNEILCIIGDRDPTGQGVTVDFFGRPCRFPQGPARFAIATGAPLLPGFVTRRTNDSFTIVIEPPIYPPETGSKEEKTREITQRYARAIEEAIRYHPEEWAVFYRIWDEEWQP